MAATYEPIVQTTLVADTTSVILGSGGTGSIPSTYTDLFIVANVRGNNANNFAMRFNSDGTNTYSTTGLSGNGSNAYSWRVSDNNYMFLDYYGVAPSTDGFATYLINIQNYSNTSTYKTAISRYGYGTKATEATVNLWRSTSAISTVGFYISNFTSNIKAGSSFAIYGIKAA